MSKHYDAIIIGTGITGLFTALDINKRLNILVITKTSDDDGNSALAQGGIVSCINSKIHFEDTMKAGSFYNNEEALKVISENSKANIDKLIQHGVNFDRDGFGNLKLTREGGHSEITILYCKDKTGKEIIRALNDKVRKSSNITILENTQVIELFKKDEVIEGIVVLDENDDIKKYNTKVVVLATGGIGKIYKDTTNSEQITGDGIALGYNIGARVKDMEFIQFHPTAMYGNSYERRFLISEAVRGEGAFLRNINGERFMNKYHPMKDLAPRDIVSRSIFKELRITKSDFVYLDITHKDSTSIKTRFPNIYKYCLKTGLDITKDYIKVAPAEHYIMGGIETDLYGKTNVEGLYACGECACTGAHGANRLASNSLLEGIVFGEKVAQSINQLYLKQKSKENKSSSIKENEKLKIRTYDNYSANYIYENKLLNIENKLRETMTQNVSIVRKKQDLLNALQSIDELEQDLNDQKSLNKKYFELKNMIIVSRLITQAALKRTKSIGAHFFCEDDWSEENC